MPNQSEQTRNRVNENIRAFSFTAADGVIPPFTGLVKVGGGLGAVTLPIPAAQEAPRHTMVIALEDVGTTSPTVATVGTTGIALDTNGDRLVLYSDGEVWNVLNAPAPAGP